MERALRWLPASDVVRTLTSADTAGLERGTQAGTWGPGDYLTYLTYPTYPTHATYPTHPTCQTRPTYLPSRSRFSLKYRT